MSFFRRRRRIAHVDVGIYSPPAAKPAIAPIENVVEDGLLISLWSVRLALKNRLIVVALRDGQPFDADALATAARDEILSVARENDESAQRVEDRRESLDVLERGLPAAVHEDEEHRRRPRVHRLLAKALRETADDAKALSNLVAGARQDAMDDVGREILAKAAARSGHLDHGPEIRTATGRVRANEDEDRAEREIGLRMLIDFDLPELEQEAGQRRTRQTDKDRPPL